MVYVHKPVLLEEVITYLVNKDDKLFLDCTIGEGGHSFEILTRFPGISVYGLDRNKEIINIARNRLSMFHHNLHLFNVNFTEASSSLLGLNDKKFNCILMDLGISMFHYKNSKRGFSFNNHEILDMRLDEMGKSVTEIVNYYSEKELSDIFFQYGEERFANRIASFIIREREKGPIKYSDQLAEIMKNAIPKKFHSKKIHPATKSFQALRIVSNNELENIRKGIPNILKLLETGGRLGVITFHSIEDRIVKQIFTYLNKDCICKARAPICTCDKKREVKWVKKKLKPSEREISQNPASRSAKLRIVEKL